MFFKSEVPLKGDIWARRSPYLFSRVTRINWRGTCYFIARESVILPVGTSLCPYGVAYRRAHGLSTCGLLGKCL